LESLSDFENISLISVEILTENEVRSQMKGSMEIVETSISVQVISLLSFIRITTRSNSLISSLSTNAKVTDMYSSLEIMPTKYFDENAVSNNIEAATCDRISPISPAGFYSFINSSRMPDPIWPSYPPYFEPDVLATVDGFFGGCYPLDGLLGSTFDCLNNVQCLQVLTDYFPRLNQVYTRQSSNIK
jgi:hypothetical protein